MNITITLLSPKKPGEGRGGWNQPIGQKIQVFCPNLLLGGNIFFLKMLKKNEKNLKIFHSYRQKSRKKFTLHSFLNKKSNI